MKKKIKRTLISWLGIILIVPSIPLSLLGFHIWGNLTEICFIMFIEGEIE